jgi:NodT family efflux transporter outer membrane factor (OMF) lipoprotein
MKFALYALAFLAASGCVLHDVKEDRQAPVVIPGSYSVIGAGEVPKLPWWERLQDPAFAAYAKDLLAQNLDLKRSWARLKQMRALAQKAGSSRMPQIDGRLGASFGQSVFNIGDQGDVTVDTTRFPLDVSVAYEVDLWGKVNSSVRAAELDVEASGHDLQAMGLSLVARAARLWFSIRQQKAHLDMLSAQENVGLDHIKLVRVRIAQGLAGALDLLQQEQQLASLRSRRPRHEAVIQTARHQLSILAGKPPRAGTWEPEAGLPALGAVPAHGLPVDLLGARPDIRAALRRVNSADHRVGVAVADRWPALRLSASGGLNGSEVGNIFTSWIYNLVANLVAPIFDGSRRSAELDRMRAVLEESVHGYGQVVLRAFGEVEDALARQRAETRTILLLGKQHEAAQSTLSEATRRYLSGLSSYLPVLQALRARQELEHNRLSAHGRAWAERIGLNLALGGAWSGETTLGEGKRDE